MRIALAIALLALSACNAPQHAQEVPPIKREAVQLTAADGVKVFGDYSEPANARALILLFHQADSGQGEYLTIVPRLASAGYATLALDQRSGGNLYGGNWTVKGLGKSAGFTEAKPDLEAALTWASRRKLPVVLWGSSYSASLAFVVAAEHPGQVRALLAFSPDEYFDGKPSVAEAAKKLGMPVFVTSAQDAKEIAAAKAVLDAVPGGFKRQFVPVEGGVHGSSTLNAEKNPKGAEAVWKEVLLFLEQAAR